MEVSECEYYTPLSDPEKWEKRILYTEPQFVPQISKQVNVLKVLACIFLSSDSNGEIALLTVTARNFVNLCKRLTLNWKRTKLCYAYQQES
ncbi:hypothetical protein C5468_21360 [Photorhabdus luminescens subsp. mexicana]|uniref:Uncharacterized protein n=1 Tax=Photorhabdus luminescens subsp. mexicana TaxID=2100167 RepID=A0A4R4IWM1_PHOLU|nr:hypothetical protein C5468_21360 [Photorhabdus luminescens subsp. mexicana]